MDKFVRITPRGHTMTNEFVMTLYLDVTLVNTTFAQIVFRGMSQCPLADENQPPMTFTTSKQITVEVTPKITLEKYSPNDGLIGVEVFLRDDKENTEHRFNQLFTKEAFDNSFLYRVWSQLTWS